MTENYNKMIKGAANKADVTKIIIDILENPSLNTFSEFLNIKEIDEVSFFVILFSLRNFLNFFGFSFIA